MVSDNYQALVQGDWQIDNCNMIEEHKGLLPVQAPGGGAIGERCAQSVGGRVRDDGDLVRQKRAAKAAYASRRRGRCHDRSGRCWWRRGVAARRAALARAWDAWRGRPSFRARRSPAHGTTELSAKARHCSRRRSVAPRGGEMCVRNVPRSAVAEHRRQHRIVVGGSGGFGC